MKSTVLTLIATLITSATALADSSSLESSLGLTPDAGQERTFATQAGADWYAQQRRTAAELQAEHLLATLHASSDGESTNALSAESRSEHGGFSSAEMKQIAHALADPRVIELLETSAYYAAVIEGRFTITE